MIKAAQAADTRRNTGAECLPLQGVPIVVKDNIQSAGLPMSSERSTSTPSQRTESSSVDNFVLFIQNTDPGSNAGIPGVQVPIGLGASSKLPIGMELDGPAGSDRRPVAIGVAIEALLGRIAPAR